MPRPIPAPKKALIVSAARRLLSNGQSLRAAAVDLGMGSRVGTLCKWLARPSLETDYSACGRPEKFVLLDEEVLELRALVLRFQSFAYAVEMLAKSPCCEPGTRALILAELDAAAREQRRARWPDSLRRRAIITQEEAAMFRGPKQTQHVAHSPRKGMFYEDESGAGVPIRAGDVWQMDDYSTNQPYIIETAAGTPRTCRQVLAAMDVYSSAWLGVEMIGRERDAYRGEDIVRFILRCIEAQGSMPRVLMLERGRWEGRAVHGLPLDDLGAAWAGKTWGGLDDLIHIIHGYSSRHKAMLESSFNLLQRALAHSGRDIGRTRGEFELATKLMLQVNAGPICPRQAGFLEQDASREAHWLAMQALNARPRERAAAEFDGKALVPNDLLQDAGEVRPLPEAHRWRFLPVKRLATVRGGYLEFSVEHYGPTFRFEVNGISALHLANGHRVLAAFDPALPSLGCYVANAEPKSRDGWAVGQALITARHAEDCPQFRLLKGGHGEGSKKLANANARTSFAAINPHKRGLTHTQAHNGEGSAALVRTGVPMAAPLLVPPAAASATTARRGVQVAGVSPPSRDPAALDPEARAEQRRQQLAAMEEA